MPQKIQSPNTDCLACWVPCEKPPFPCGLLRFCCVCYDTLLGACSRCRTPAILSAYSLACSEDCGRGNIFLQNTVVTWLIHTETCSQVYRPNSIKIFFALPFSIYHLLYHLIYHHGHMRTPVLQKTFAVFSTQSLIEALMLTRNLQVKK